MLTLRRERERDRERARVVGAVERARTRLDDQNFESARHADGALTLEPQSPRLTSRVLVCVASAASPWPRP